MFTDGTDSRGRLAAGAEPVAMKARCTGCPLVRCWIWSVPVPCHPPGSSFALLSACLRGLLDTSEIR